MPLIYLTFTSIIIFLNTFPFNIWAPVDIAFKHHFTAISLNDCSAWCTHSPPISSSIADIGMLREIT